MNLNKLFIYPRVRFTPESEFLIKHFWEMWFLFICFRWDSLGEYLATAIGFQELGDRTNSDNAKLLGKISHMQLNNRQFSKIA